METKTTPMMQQWHACKAKAKEALLLFRLGDFYEAFYEDAYTLSEAADVTLTKRGDIPMSGIPAHTAENYIEKLVNKGLLIALAEQVEDPKETKGIVKREIVRLISPGAVYTPSLLSDKTNNFFASICFLNARFGLSFLDLTTADFKTIEVENLSDLEDELYRLRPTEILIQEKFISLHPEWLKFLKDDLSIRCTIKENWHFEHEHCFAYLIRHFHVHNLDGFGLKGQIAATNSAGALLNYMQEDLCLEINHITNIETYHLGDYMLVDQTTQRHLEIFQSQHAKETKHTLLHLIDRTATPMGARLLREYLAHPLLSVEKINQRLDATEELLKKISVEDLGRALEKIRDIERLILRIKTGYNSPKDIIALKDSLIPLPIASQFLSSLESTLFKEIEKLIPNLEEVTNTIIHTLVDQPPLRLHEGDLIKSGVSKELDELKNLKNSSQEFLLQYQEKLKEDTGIKTLKVGFSKAFGYFIEISRGQSSKVPPFFHKRQTLVNSERFITDELLQYENKILNAEELIYKLEVELYQKLRDKVISFEESIRKAAKGVAQLDTLLSFALLAKSRGYIRPILDNGNELYLKEARHPVIESCDPFSSFIPNDTKITEKDQRLLLITGPNMAGKSTYMRQVALICIMAQIGCYVPASHAHLGITDKVFSRIGASDDLSRGQSTFMVEMTETANILRHATPRSLIILDEIGRGTSTYDGIAIAWSVAEYLLTNPQKFAKTLFATHYWELTALEGKYKGAVNYHVAVKEIESGIVFLRKIVQGGTDKSYGIHVAELAGLPSQVLKSAISMLKNLEKGKVKTKKDESEQLSLFAPQKADPIHETVIKEMKSIYLGDTTPLQALTLLEKWQQLLKST